MYSLALLTLLAVIIIPHLVDAYGEPDSAGRPVWQERANHVFLNAARINPTQYKSVYMSGFSPSPSGIFTDTTLYSARAPLYLEPRLVNSAVYHSNDMATNNFMEHNSFNGTTTFDRIKAFYNCNGGMGENIAAGNADPLDTNNQWICDKTGSVCATDGDGNDGHRKNIMSSTYKVVGTGYGYNSAATYDYYWTQDFGGAACNTINNKIYGGSHRAKSGTTKFIAVYYVSPAATPSSANVVIAGTSYALSVDVGSAGQATYAFSQTSGTACRPYYFQIDSYRYPDTGCLVTYGEGSCTTSFDATCGGTSVAATSVASTTAATTAAATTTTTARPTTTTTTRNPSTAATSASATTTSRTTSAAATTSRTTATVGATSSRTTATTAATTSRTTTTVAAATTSRTTATTGSTTSRTTATTGATSSRTTATTAATSSRTTATTAATSSRTTATTATTSRTTATTGSPSTSGTVGGTTRGTPTHVIYDSAFQNNWQVLSNGVSSSSVTYSGQSALALNFKASPADFVIFDHDTLGKDWTQLEFDAASSASTSILVYINGGYYSTFTLTTGWSHYVFVFNFKGDEDWPQIVFQTSTGATVTVYVNDIVFV